MNHPQHLDNAVTPTEDISKSGEYKPLSRPLFIYVNKASLKHPEVVAFLRYYLSPEGQERIKAAKAIALDPTEYEKQLAKLEEAISAAQ